MAPLKHEVIQTYSGMAQLFRKKNAEPIENATEPEEEDTLKDLLSKE